MSVSRASKRNVTGGSGFKKGVKGQEGFRAKAAREAADDMIDLLFMPESKLKTEDKEALKYMQVARISKKFGNGRMEVYCQDGTTRQAAIRGLLRRKGQVFFDLDSMVVIALRADDANCGADIIGLLNGRHVSALSKLEGIDQKLFFSNRLGLVTEEDDYFDRSNEAEHSDNESEIDIDNI